MNQQQSLAGYFAGWARGRSARLAVAGVVGALADASLASRMSSARARSRASSGRSTGKRGEVDEQKEIDVLANDRIVTALRSAPVAAVASEEMDDPLLLDAKAPLLVAIDPLDGSSNVDANASIGTIFTVLPALEHNEEPSAFLQPGVNQLAAASSSTVRRPCSSSASAPARRSSRSTAHRSKFLLTHAKVEIPPRTSEYAINASNCAPLGRSDPDLRG